MEKLRQVTGSGLTSVVRRDGVMSVMEDCAEPEIKVVLCYGGERSKTEFFVREQDFMTADFM